MDVRDEVRAKLVELTQLVLGVDAESLTDDTNYTDDLGAKSSAMTMILTQMEDEFDVEIPYLGAKRAATLGGTVEFKQTGKIRRRHVDATDVILVERDVDIKRDGMRGARQLEIELGGIRHTGRAKKLRVVSVPVADVLEEANQITIGNDLIACWPR